MGALKVPASHFPTKPDFYLATYGMGVIHLSVAITILYFSTSLALKISNNNRGAEVIKFFQDAGLVLIILEILGEIVIPILSWFCLMEWWNDFSPNVPGFVLALLADLSLLIMTSVGFYGILKVNINLVTLYINLKVISSFLIIFAFVVLLAVFKMKYLILDVVLYFPIILYGLDFFVLHLNVMMMTRPADIKQTSHLRPSLPSGFRGH